MPRTTTVEKFKTAAKTGAIKIGTAGLSRSTLEGLVAAGVAKRIETIGHAWSGRSGGQAATYRPSSVRYAAA